MRAGATLALVGALALPTAAPCADDPPMPPPVSSFHQPRAPCGAADGKRIITQVGRLRTPSHENDLEVVASAVSDDDKFATTDARLTLFDAKCRVAWQQAFPHDGEVTFEVLHWPYGATLLHVVAVSAIFYPVDDTVFTHTLLLLTGYGLLTPMQPSVLTSDRTWRVYIGRLNKAGDYGIVKINTPWMGGGPHDLRSSVFTWRWTSYKLLDGPNDLELTGPTVRQAPLDRSTDAWPDTSWEVGFPLWHYLFKNPF